MSSRRMRFVLPEDGRKIAGLVEAVPTDWSRMSGQLNALPVLFEHVVSGIGYEFHDTSLSLTCRVVAGTEKGSRRVKPDYRALVGGGRPAFVSFYLPLHGTGVLDEARGVAAEAVRNGYRGELYFSLNDHWGTAASSIRFVMNPKAEVQRPPYVEVMVTEGEEAVAESFLAACRGLGLIELVVAAAPASA